MMSGAERIAELEQRVVALEEQLVRTQKLTALGELLGTTTHEFNNVLTTIINYAKMGLRHRDDATRDKAFDKVLSAGQRAARITQSVLGLARNRASGCEPTALAPLVQDSLFLLERELAKYRVQVELQLDPVPDALANGNQIQQVLLNLLINARQAMTSGGRVLIRLSHDAAHDMVALQVRDTGPGIPQEHLRRLFEPFFSTKQGPDATGKGGSGLGLFACRNIIEAHHGRLRVESTVGKGTAFTVLLPVAKKTPLAVPTTAVPTIASPTIASPVLGVNEASPVGL